MLHPCLLRAERLNHGEHGEHGECNAMKTNEASAAGFAMAGAGQKIAGSPHRHKRDSTLTGCQCQSKESMLSPWSRCSPWFNLLIFSLSEFDAQDIHRVIVSRDETQVCSIAGSPTHDRPEIPIHGCISRPSVHRAHRRAARAAA